MLLDTLPVENTVIFQYCKLPYAHKILTGSMHSHRIEDCLFCQKVMKEAIDICFSKYYWVRVIAVILGPTVQNGWVCNFTTKRFVAVMLIDYLEKINKDFRDVYEKFADTDSSNSKSYEMLDAMGRPSSKIQS
ncbi:hypothetical protein CUMW_238870 [Citrus unshiu]|uniref:Uncharacterized protein n=1 Tax=Citrus unshiu TaxID=55188 RepID=A0A2H5QKH9_CITUN|nr:hypothetical protein CUMW_238870 [Citrus unshiu]